MNDQINRHKLKPCPFCGGEAVVDMDDDWYWEWKAYCPVCGCDLGYFKTKEEAIEAWNRRESQPPADQWIPCSSGRLPKEKEIVHVTILNEDSGERRTADTKYDGRDYVIRLDYSERIVAWMPANLPEPYKGE